MSPKGNNFCREVKGKPLEKGTLFVGSATTVFATKKQAQAEIHRDSEAERMESSRYNVALRAKKARFEAMIRPTPFLR